MKDKKCYLFIVLSGILMGLCFNIPLIAIIAWGGLIPLFYVLFKGRISNRKAYLYMFTYGMVFYLSYMLCLIALYPLDWMGFSNSVSILVVISGIIGFSLLEAFFLGFIGVFFNICKSKNNIINSISIGFIWIIFEFVQGLGIMGFTGGQLAASQFQYLPIIQSVSLFGSLFISFLIVTVNSFLLYAIGEKENRKKYIIIILIIFISNFFFGIISMSIKSYEGNVKVAVIQGNVASGQKWEKGMTMKIYDKYIDLTKEAIKEEPEIVIWPETAIPVDISNNDKLYNSYIQIAKEIDGIFLSGVIASKEIDSKENDFNAVIAIDKNGYIAPTYFKRHLVPFGEFIPYRNILVKIAPLLNDIAGLGDLTPGEDANVIDTNLGKIGNLICYESIFSNLARESIKEGAELFVVATNDSWFEDSSATTKHFSHSILRAVEYERFLVRAGNTGISSIIMPNGMQLDTIKAMEEGYLIGDVQFLQNRTVYSYVGDIIVLIGLMWILIVCTLKLRKNR